MATGVNKLETVSDEAILASAVSELLDEFPLPADNSKVGISYEGKLSIEKILTKSKHRFVSAIERQDLSAIGAPLNSLFWADNYYAMQFLLQNYSGKIRLIYTDPPYGTGLDFHSRKIGRAHV